MSGPQMINGITVPADTTVYSAKKETEVYQADGAISAGSPVMLDTGDTTCVKVVAATSITGCVGIYEGEGGTGANAGTGFTGKDAVTGDPINVTTRGMAIANVAGNTTAVSDGEALDVQSAGVLAGGAAVDNYAAGKIIAKEATTSAAAAVVVFVM